MLFPARQIGLILLLAIAFRSFRQYMGGCVCTEEGSLVGRIALVIAADTEIGLATTRGLARRGATVVMACQVVEVCNKARVQLINEFGGSKNKDKTVDSSLTESKMKEDTIIGVGNIKSDQIYIRQLHLASAADVRAFSNKFLKEFKQLNIMIVNAVHLHTTLDVTVNGFERNLGLNYLSSYLLCEYLIPRMLKSSSVHFLSRLIFVSSRLHQYGEMPTIIEKVNKEKDEKNFSWWKAYTESQLALITYANSLNTRTNSVKMRIASVHPGFENRLFRLFVYEPFAYFLTWFGKTPWQSAQSALTMVFRHPGTEGVYFEDCVSVFPHPMSFNPKASAKLIEMTRASLAPYLPKSQSPKDTAQSTAGKEKLPPTGTVAPASPAIAEPATTVRATPTSTGTTVPPSTGMPVPLKTGAAAPPPTGSTVPPVTGKTGTPTVAKVSPPPTAKMATPPTAKAVPPATRKMAPPPTAKAVPATTGKTAPPPTAKAVPAATGKTAPPPIAVTVPAATGSTPPPSLGKTMTPTNGKASPPPTGKTMPPPTTKVKSPSIK